MRGVYLHVLADALGSVGVITSSLLIQYRGWWIADPVCSLFISLLICSSVVPLLRSTSDALMMRTPRHLQARFDATLAAARARHAGVVARVAHAHLWRHLRAVLVATVRVSFSHATTAAHRDVVVADLVAALRREVGATDVTVQSEAAPAAEV